MSDIVVSTEPKCLGPQGNAQQPQPESTEKTEINPSVPLQEKQADTTDRKVILNYEQDIDYKPEGQILRLSQSIMKKR